MSLPERNMRVEPPRNAQQGAGQSFVRRNGVGIGAGVAAALVIAVGVYFFLSTANDQPVRRVQEITMVRIQPPPPPPPPPPPEQPKMVEQPKMIEQPKVPDKPLPQPPKPLPPRPVSAPAAVPLGVADKATTNQGDFLAGSADGNCMACGGGDGGGPFGQYAAVVSEQLQQALEANKKTRSLSADQLIVRVWADYDTGRIQRVSLGSSTGDPSVDAAITNDVLVGMRLNQLPPRDMPMPIVTRISGKRPT